ncbi:MAG: methyl-accepting chemotaxis protein [Spirochaetia bacterium]|jgi:methyl-accepting chemotaxis protein|nr:methyl-accepting chemotaxis protein [Spirochaetia bacterium]
MKITAKLAASSAALLIPAAVMLFLIISSSGSAVRQAEQKSVDCLRGAAELMRLIPEYGASADPAKITELRNKSAKLLNELENGLDVLEENSAASFHGRLVRSLVAAVLITLIAFIIVLRTNSRISKSAGQLKTFFKKLDANDLSISLEIKSVNEFGELASALNRFLAKLRDAFTSFSRNAAMVSDSVYDLSASAKEISTTANEQSASVAEIVSTMEGNKNLSEQIALKTAEVAELALETQELGKRGAHLRDANQDMMQDIREQNGKIIDEIKNLADMINRIDETIAIIDTIADQTKLIAFNAALEASSSDGAEEASARFAVVAGEIRRFAGNVVESTGEIKEKISEVQSASQSLIEEANNGSKQIDSGYERMVEQKVVFENIVEISQNVATRSQQISNLSKQQESASSQIFQALKEISGGVQQFVNATASTAKIADGLNVMSVGLRETVAEYKTGKKQEEL